MKAVILAGGLGTRISEETQIKPKPMVEIGGRPILWHILKLYSHYGINDFVICCGYKGYVIKEYFANYFLHMSDVTFHMDDGHMEVHRKKAEPWKITLLDTGESTNTGGRLKRIKEHIDRDSFCFTYGDGVADINIGELIKFHDNHGLKATLTAVQPPGRYGSLNINREGTKVLDFTEKPQGDGGWINGGFFIVEPSVIDEIKDDASSWENETLRKLASQNQLGAYHHKGYWQAMDTLREKNLLQRLWEEDKAPWKVWK